MDKYGKKARVQRVESVSVDRSQSHAIGHVFALPSIGLHSLRNTPSRIERQQRTRMRSDTAVATNSNFAGVDGKTMAIAAES